MAEPLNQAIYNKAYVSSLAQQLSHSSAIDAEEFSASVLNDSWAGLSLKERMRHITLCLKDFLPSEYPEAIDILCELAGEKRSSKYQGFADMCFPDFVECFGIDHYNISIKALHFLTRFSSSEFAIRPFIIKFPEKTMAEMLRWAEDENFHVRRLASEGCRPRLPWAMALPDYKRDPAPILPILEQLRTDSEDYVRRSVANNLNDIAKDHPEVVLNIGKRWIGTHPHTDWIVKHACRSLLKRGNPKVMALFGFAEDPNISIRNLSLLPKSISIGEDATFSFELLNHEAQQSKLRIEYGIYYVKANGRQSKKVFHLSEGAFGPGTHSFTKTHSFVERTTRKHYPGIHKLSIIINGGEKVDISFEVVAQ